jgi:endonuclease/exonuclease/phosphatase family metal-dependent hydrolase
MFIVNRIVFALNGIAMLMLLLSYAAPYISPEIYWPVAFLGLGYPLLVLTNLVFIIYWIAVFKLKFLYSLVAISLGYSFIPSYVQLGAKKITERENTITVMSFNMSCFGAYAGKKIEDPDKFFDVFDKINPDVICFQEFKDMGTAVEKDMYKRLFKKLEKYYSYGTYLEKGGKKNAYGMAMFSRFPIVNKGIVEQVEQNSNYTEFIDIVVNNDTIRALNTHLRSIKFDRPDYQAIEDLSLTNDSSVNRYSIMSRKLKTAFIGRAKQAETVKEFIDESPHPVVLSGDFNDSPTSYAYRTVKGKKKDAFIESGSGLGRTYVGRMPSFRIDYILYDASFTSYNYYAKAFEFSDHKMISCTIKVK